MGKTGKGAGFKTVAIPRKLWDEISSVVTASGVYANEAEFVREAVRDKLRGFTLVEVRELSDQAVDEEIVAYIKGKGKAYPSDIAADRGIPYFSVLRAIDRLMEKGVLEPAERA